MQKQLFDLEEMGFAPLNLNDDELVSVDGGLDVALPNGVICGVDCPGSGVICGSNCPNRPIERDDKILH